MGKKMIIITAAIGLISFGGAFGVAWLTGAPRQTPSPGAEDAFAGAHHEPNLAESAVFGSSLDEAAKSQMKRAMTEKRLKSLIYEVREKIQEYESRIESLRTQQERLEIVRESLRNDITNLENLRVELAAAVASLKEQRDKLDKSRIEIAKMERANFESIAAAYDKMDSASASKILVSISQTQGGNGDDAVKILHYMTERTKANVLAELAAAEPAVAAQFCQRLKTIKEKE